MSALTKKQLEDILSVSVSGLNSKLEVMEKKLDALENLPARLSKMESLLEKVNKENGDLVKAMAYKEEQINSLQRQLNSLEQHNRSWSIRVSGLNIPTEVENSNTAVKKIVYDSLLLPIFKGAVEKGDLPSIPPPREHPGDSAYPASQG
jgi:chromosome segregation ATPase